MNRLIFISLFLLWSMQLQADWFDLWFTADQQGQTFFEQGEFSAAAEKFTTPERIGAALYRAGEFEKAAAALGRSTQPGAMFNRGNALVFLGEYEKAIVAYSSALESRPEWPEALQNLAVAQARLERLATPQDDAGGTGGQLSADEIVFDDAGSQNQSDNEEILDEGGEALSEEAMRSMWLRRVETSPADFLANRFAYQLSIQQNQNENE
jgi:Ca-activated chloride channel family protein